MNSQLLNYIEACREAGLSDNEIAENLLQVGWQQSEISKVLHHFNIDPQALPEDAIPATPAPEIQEVVTAEEQINLLAGDTDKPQNELVKKPRYNFLTRLKKHFSQSKPKSMPAFNNDQIIIGPDGQKYQMYFYPVSNTDEDTIPGTAVTMRPQSERFNKFWNIVDIGKRVAIITALLLTIIYVAFYFYDLQTKANKIGKNIDSVTFDNMEQLRKKVEEYYQKNRKLPPNLNAIDPKADYSINNESNTSYDYKIVDASSFQICTIMSSGSGTYKSGYVCQPYLVNTAGMVSSGTAINPAGSLASLPQTGSTPKIFPGCTDPKPLLSANAKCTDINSNCGKPMFNQEFGMSSAGLSNTKDRLAQTFTLPKDKAASQITEFAPFVVMAGGGSACMAIYENSFENDPLSGREIAEYTISLAALKANQYNPLYINPIILTKGKSYSFVFSLLTNDASLTIARGMELSSYKDGNAYYLKRNPDTCSKNCPLEAWVNREDDLKFKIMFY